MLDAAKGEIEPGWGDVLRRTFERHPALMRDRTRDPTGFALVHGDVNPGNVLSPLAGVGPTYLIDRQPFDWSLTTWLGAADIAYLMVHWWPTDRRRRLETDVLRRYHDGLHRRGVTGYPWDRLVADYRLCAVQSIYVAVSWCILEDDRTTMRWVWLPQLKRSLAAFADLRCDALWS
jgi:thiamine kinase-like enzyme